MDVASGIGNYSSGSYITFNMSAMLNVIYSAGSRCEEALQWCHFTPKKQMFYVLFVFPFKRSDDATVDWGKSALSRRAAAGSRSY